MLSSPSATVASEFLQLDLGCRRAKQHSRAQLPKCFKAFANAPPDQGRTTVRADQHTESEE